MEASAEKPLGFAAKDAGFHRRPAEATHNPLLSAPLDSLQNLMREARALVAAAPRVADRVMPARRAVLGAAAARDGAGAGRAMRDHLAIAVALQQELLQSVKPAPAPPAHSGATG